MGVRSYFEGLFKNLGEDLSQQEKRSREYTEHLLHGKPLSEEARKHGEEMGMNAMMPMFTVSPHTHLWRGIVKAYEDRFGRNILHPENKKFKESVQNLLYNIDPDLASRIDVKTGKNLQRGVSGHVYYDLPTAASDDENLKILNQFYRGEIDNPGYHHRITIKPLAQVEREGGKRLAEQNTTLHHELGHARDLEQGFAPRKRLAEEAGGIDRFQQKIHQASQKTTSFVRSPAEAHAENMGFMYTHGLRNPYSSVLADEFPGYGKLMEQQYVRDIENALKYRGKKLDTLNAYRNRIAGKALEGNPILGGIAESKMSKPEIREAEKALEKMGLFQKPPTKIKDSKATEILKKMGLL